MNVQYINPFINACIDVFDTFAGLMSVAGKPVARAGPGAEGDIKGIIGLNGHGINGYFIISFHGPFLKKIIATLFDDAAGCGQEELNDLAGELTNMISGNAKAELSKKGFFFDVAVPRITRAAPDIPPQMAGTPVIMVPFATRSGRYVIEASIKKIKEDNSRPPGTRETDPALIKGGGSFTAEEFAKATGLPVAKVKSFLRTGFLKGRKNGDNTWQIHRDEIKKFKKNA